MSKSVIEENEHKSLSTKKHISSLSNLKMKPGHKAEDGFATLKMILAQGKKRKKRK